MAISSSGLSVESCKEPACQCRRHKRGGSIPGSGRSPGGGRSNPLYYSCLENPMDRGAWWAQSMGSQRTRHKWNHLARAYRLDGKGEKYICIVNCVLNLYSFFSFNFLHKLKRFSNTPSTFYRWEKWHSERPSLPSFLTLVSVSMEI